MNKTAAVVVTYNRKALLAQCLMHLLEQTAPVDILVIDNASTDGTCEMFADVPESVHYFNTGANLGGAGGFNYGMRKAVELGYEYVWVMDDDSLPEPTAHGELLCADARYGVNYGWLSSQTLWTDGTPCSMNIQKLTKWSKLRDFGMEQKAQYASFVSLFLRAQTIREFGLPYKEFFIWGDDWEFTRRISKRLACYYVPASKVTHACKDNNGSDIVCASADKLGRHEYSYRNDVVIYRQDGVSGYLFLLIRAGVHSAKILIKAQNKGAKLKLMFSSLRRGLRFRPQVEYTER